MSLIPLNERCEAEVDSANHWYTYRCSRKAKETIEGHKLCAQHANKARSRGVSVKVSAGRTWVKA